MNAESKRIHYGVLMPGINIIDFCHQAKPCTPEGMEGQDQDRLEARRQPDDLTFNYPSILQPTRANRYRLQ